MIQGLRKGTGRFGSAGIPMTVRAVFGHELGIVIRRVGIAEIPIGFDYGFIGWFFPFSSRLAIRPSDAGIAEPGHRSPAGILACFGRFR